MELPTQSLTKPQANQPIESHTRRGGGRIFGSLLLILLRLCLAALALPLLLRGRRGGSGGGGGGGGWESRAFTEPSEVGGETLAVKVGPGKERRRELRILHGSPSPPRRTNPLALKP